MAAAAVIHRAICNRYDSKNGRPNAPSAAPAAALTASGTRASGVTTAAHRRAVDGTRAPYPTMTAKNGRLQELA